MINSSPGREPKPCCCLFPKEESKLSLAWVAPSEENTLFLEHGKTTWHEMWNILSDNARHFILIEACTSKANRYYLLACRHCKAACKGKYGSSSNTEQQQAARLDLARFILDQDFLDEGVK